jgi:Glycosyl transferases group 1/Glycosyltransferase Family 4
LGEAATKLQMRICGYFHLFPPEHNAGSETTVHAALRAMVRRGHRVTVVCDRSKTAPYTIDGIDVARPPRRGLQSWMAHYVRDADLLVTHLDLTSQAMMLALDTKKPLVHFVHNSAQLKYWHVNTLKCQLAVFNSQWIADLEKWPGAQIVIHPVVEPQYYRCKRGGKITLVNPTPGKGANVLKALASIMPNREFLVAEGGYGEQIITRPRSDPKTEAKGNIEWMAHTPDIREVFQKTKILLMPSDYESYGRVGIEAACAGIPTIAHPTPGLKEAFGDAAIFCDRNDIAAWYVEIERLLTDEVYYRKRSDMALALVETLDPESEFDRLEQAFIQTVKDWQTRDEVKAVRMWTCDRWIWKMADGSFKAVDDQRIPTGAVTLFAGKGTPVPEAVAKGHGWISSDVKAIESPAENKAIESPQENKSRRKTA